MKNSVKFIFAILVIGSLSCDKIDKIGPDLCPTADFSYSVNDLVVDGLNANAEVDLSVEGLNIKAKFTEEVDWTLKIISSTAVKAYSGKSDSINVRWFGNVDAFPLFKAGTARIELEIACLDKIEKAFTITVDPNFKNLHPSYGIVLRDFDKNGFASVAGEQFMGADGWNGLKNSGDTSHYEYFNSDPSVSGGRYAELYAKTASETWYHGGTSFSFGGFAGSLSTTNADSVYLNFFCKGYGLVNTGLEIALQVSGDNSGNFFHTEPITWEGWKLVSLKLSDLKILGGFTAGERFVNVDGLSGVIMQLGSNPEKSTEARSAYDFIMLTVGEPFVPNN